MTASTDVHFWDNTKEHSHCSACGMLGLITSKTADVTCVFCRAHHAFFTQLRVEQAELTNDQTEYKFVKSHTRPGINYLLTIVNGLPRSCECENFKREIRRVQPYVCKHMDAEYKARQTDKIVSNSE